MAFDARVFRVAIASPGDVAIERQIATEVIYEWNAEHSAVRNIVALPVKWETHAVANLSGRSQGSIIDHVVADCDLMVAIYWSKVGTHTDHAEGGTAEEIEFFCKQGKPVALYFSGAPVPRRSGWTEDGKRLEEFKERIKTLGLVWDYPDANEFKNCFRRQLNAHITALAEGRPLVQRVLTPSADLAAVFRRQDGIYISDYENPKTGEVKSFYVHGEIDTIRNDLHRLGGKDNVTVGGVLFHKKKEIAVRDFLNRHRGRK